MTAENKKSRTRQFVDLHTHSSASDGSLSPAELIDFAERKHLAAIALTDHDTIDGLAQARKAAEKYPNLRFVAGIEVSAIPPSGTLHILGLSIDENAPSLVELAGLLSKGRERRNPKIIENCRRLGLEIEMDDVLAEADRCGSPKKIISRVHIARALERKGYVCNTQEAFDKYLARGGPAYADRERMNPRQTFGAIRQAGGIAVLAHPSFLKCDNTAQLERIVREFMDYGMEGIEVFHSNHNDRQVREYFSMAKRYGLIVTGGSDFHGAGKPNVRLGKPRVPMSVVEESLNGKIASRFAECLFG